MLLVVIVFFIGGSIVNGDYRHYSLDNADLCGTGRSSSLMGERNSPLSIGSGASIFKLSRPSIQLQPNFHNKDANCKIHVRAPKGHGISVYIQEIRMRRTSQLIKDSKCLDYIQFGRDDILPFITVNKSPRICSEEDGKRAFDDPNGDLLIWLRLGGRKETRSWPHISVVNVTLVVTVYKSCDVPDATQIKCSDSFRCIWKTYVCDKHINCPMDAQPADEKACDYTSLQPIDKDAGVDTSPRLHLVSLALLIFCVIVCSILLILLFLRLKSGCFKRRCRERRPEDNSQPVYSLHELSRTNAIQDNVYSPLTRIPEGPHDGLPPLEEPPPAYGDLFPQAAETQQSSVSEAASNRVS